MKEKVQPGKKRIRSAKLKDKPVATPSDRQTEVSRRSFLKMAAVAGVGAAFAPWSFAQAKPITLTYWHGWTGEWTKMVQDVVAAFHAKQDRIRIQPLVVPYDSLLAKLTAAVAAGNPPDIVTLFGSTAIPTLANQNVLIALDEIKTADLDQAQSWFSPEVYRLGQYKGKTYGLSYWAGAYAFLYNKDHFKAAGFNPDKGPATLEELDGMAEKLTQKGAGGRLARMGFLPNSNGDQVWLFGTGFGGKFYDSTSGTVTANDPKIVEALTWFQSYAKRYDPKAVASFQASLANERATNFDPFISGKFSIMSQGPWKLGDLKKFGQGVNFGVVKPPLPKAGAQSYNWTWGDIQVIPKGSKNPEAAAEFVAFTGGVGDEAGYVKRVTWGNRPINVPVSKKVLKEPDFMAIVKAFPGFDVYIDSLLNAERVGSPPVMPAAAFYSERMTAAVQKIMLMQQEPKAAMDELTKAVQQQLQMSGK